MILGTQYYRPPFPDRRFWEKDLDRMKESGLNTVQLWVVWAWVEPEPGKFDFADYDALFDEAEKRGLQVVLSTIAELQPYWIHRIVPDGYMVDHRGNKVISSNRREANQGLTPGGCTDHPEVRQRMMNFLGQVARHYKDRQNLAGWDCWNELRWNVNSDGLVCFCEHTLQAFRDWLKDKYQDLEGVNAAWKRRYCSFADILPGKVPGRTYTEMMEFQSFIQWRAADHLRQRVAAIKAEDKQHLISAHGADPSIHKSGDDENHAINRGNDWDLAEHLDALGCSHFPFWFDISYEDYAARLEATHSAAGDKQWWISELEGGMVSTGFNVFSPVRAKLQQRWIWNAFARGAKAIIFWCWRDEVFGRESAGFGLAGKDGFAGERLDAMKKTGEILNRHGGLLESYQPDPARIGVVFAPDTYNLEWAEEGVAERAKTSIYGYLEVLEKIQVPYTILESSHLDDLSDIKLIIMPWPLVVAPQLREKLLAFVQDGGVLLVEGEADAYTNVGFYQYPGQDRPFADALGIHYLRKRGLDQEQFTVNYQGEIFNLTGTDFFTPLKPSINVPRTHIIAQDNENNIRMMQNYIGKGSVIACSDFLGREYNRSRYADFEYFIARLAQECQTEPELKVTAKEPIQWRSGRAGGERLLFIINPENEQKVQVEVPGNLLADGIAVYDLTAEQELKIKQQKDAKQFTVEIPAGEYALIRWPAES